MSEHTEAGSIVADSTTTTPSVQIYQKGDKIGGQYLVHQVIRDGGLADVYFCTETKIDQPYALKTFKPQHWANEKIRHLFEQEIDIWVALKKHPNIVRCYYLHMLDNLPFIVLEWVADPQRERVDLGYWLKHHGALNLHLALNIAIDICHGLIHAQQRHVGLIHCDLKPTNILLTTDGTAKITDFGLARTSQTIQMGTGTPGYAAPEQWHGGVVDSRVDIYALGCIMYEMLTKQTPFKLEDFKPEKISWPDSLPLALYKIIQSCLQKEPAQRLGQIETLLSQLEQIYCQQFGEKRPQPVIEKFDDEDYAYTAITYHQRGKFDNAIADYNEAIHLNPKSSSHYVMQGLSYQKKGFYDEAMANYSRAIRLNDEYKFFAYHQRGNLFIVINGNSCITTKYYNSAISDYKKSLNLNPHQPNVHYMLGLSLIAIYYHNKRIASNKRIARVKEARKHLHIAIELDPNLANGLSEDLHNIDNIIQFYDNYNNNRTTTTD